MTLNYRLSGSRRWLLFLFASLLFIVIALRNEVDAFPTFGRNFHEELYRDLGLTKSASKADIRSAFRKLTRENHPDLKDGSDDKDAAKAAMARILRAYEVLSDDKKKSLYDETGVIPGEAFDTRGSSVDEIFNYFHQTSPIFSKSTTLESVKLLERIIAFRGRRLFLFQVYDDSCRGCRDFSIAWETFYETSIVKAGILEMYRIDAKSPEGAVLLSKLKIKYRGIPIVFAYLDGVKWSFHRLRSAIKAKSQKGISRNLQDFIMGFFSEEESAIGEIGDNNTEALQKFLQEPRAAERPMRVLIPRYIFTEYVPLALRMSYPDLDICQVPRDMMMRLVKYCGLKVDVRNSLGEKLEIPALIVASKEPLPDSFNLSASPEGPESCNGIHIGASASLTFDKASDFLKSLIPPRHAGMLSLPYLDAMNFYEVCKENCIVWVRQSCAGKPNTPATAPHEKKVLEVHDIKGKKDTAAANDENTELNPDVHKMVKLLTRSYYSFKTGYMCADEHPLLLGRFPELKTAKGPVLYAILNSDDAVPYWFSKLSETPIQALTASDIDKALLGLMSARNEAKDGVPHMDKVEEGKASEPSSETTAKAGPPIASVLEAKGFPMTKKQSYFHMFSNLNETIGSFLKTYMPILIMYFFHTKVLNRWTNRQRTGQGIRDTLFDHPQPRRSTSPEESSMAGVKASNCISSFTSEDLEEAKKGKGFLILILDERSDSDKSIPPSQLASDSRFTLRFLGSGSDQWKEWMREVASAPEAVGNSQTKENDNSLIVLAVRKTKLTVFMKPKGQDLDSFLGNLLDGSLASSRRLPSWALKEDE